LAHARRHAFAWSRWRCSRVCERVGDPELLTVWLSLEVPVVDALRVADVDPVSVGEGEQETLGVAVWLPLCDCVTVAVPEPEPL